MSKIAAAVVNGTNGGTTATSTAGPRTAGSSTPSPAATSSKIGALKSKLAGLGINLPK